MVLNMLLDSKLCKVFIGREANKEACNLAYVILWIISFFCLYEAKNFILLILFRKFLQPSMIREMRKSPLNLVLEFLNS